MSRFNFHLTDLDGLVMIERYPLHDDRGYLSRLFCHEEFKENGITINFIQVNHTFTSKKGTIRGMHFQHPPFVEDKYVSCIRGKIFDVAIDLRAGSPTFLKWHGEILSADNNRSLYIPKGFAHGFQSLEDNCELIYFHSLVYNSDYEDGINAFDPSINISWKLDHSNMSKRDLSHALLSEGFKGIKL